MENKVLAEHNVCNNRGESQHLQILLMIYN